MHWGTHGWGMGLGWIYMLIFWTVVIALIAYFVRSAAKRTECGAMHESPVEILKKRYSSGEITKEEFDRMKEDLKRT